MADDCNVDATGSLGDVFSLRSVFIVFLNELLDVNSLVFNYVLFFRLTIASLNLRSMAFSKNFAGFVFNFALMRFLRTENALLHA